MGDEFFDEVFATAPVMAILRGMGPERTVKLAHRAWDTGIVCVEIPLQNPEDLDSLKATVSAGRERGFAVGAGTIITVRHVAEALECGAAFAVSPGTDLQTMEACRDAKLPHLPGVATASDIQVAMSMDARWVKAFPASVLGPEWFKAMRGPFPTMSFVATGGIDAHNAEEFLASGAKVVAVGSALEDPRQLELLGRYATGSFDSAVLRLKDSLNAE